MRACVVACSNAACAQEELERVAKTATDSATFIRDLNRKVFTEDEGNLGERLQSVRHTISRNAAGDE